VVAWQGPQDLVGDGREILITPAPDHVECPRFARWGHDGLEYRPTDGAVDGVLDACRRSGNSNIGVVPDPVDVLLEAFRL